MNQDLLKDLDFPDRPDGPAISAFNEIAGKSVSMCINFNMFRLVANRTFHDRHSLLIVVKRIF